MCYILTLDWAVNQRCTCVKKRKQVGVMKEYRQMLVAVELIGDRKARVRASLQIEGCGPEQPQPRCGRSTAMVKRRSWINIVVCPCLHSSLIRHRIINPFENKVWEIHIFIKKWVRSFIEVHKLCLIMFPLIFVLWLYNRCCLEGLRRAMINRDGWWEIAKGICAVSLVWCDIILHYVLWTSIDLIKENGFTSGFFNSISTFVGYLIPEPSLEKNRSDTI